MALITDLTQYETDREAVKEYYANLLILQYRNKPKARKTIKLWADIFLADGLVFQLPDILDIDKAAGASLNIIGKILNCPRIVQGLVIDRKFFQFHQDENSIGFSRVGLPKHGSFKTIANSNLSEYELDDTNYRMLLKFKALANVLRGSIADMDNALYSVFGENVIMQTNQDLTVNYVVRTNNILAVQAANLLGYFKAPIGIKSEYIIAVPERADANGFMMPMLFTNSLSSQ
jgi:hypothetical protein